MSTTVCFTQGHISVKRGRITRQYHNPTQASFHRLGDLTFSGAVIMLPRTQRSFGFRWYGLSTLTHQQLALYDLFLSSKGLSFGFQNGVLAACRVAGIHSMLLCGDPFGE